MLVFLSAADGVLLVFLSAADGVLLCFCQLLQEEPVSAVAAGISEDAPPSTATDSNSCSSGATNYTDSGAEPEKVHTACASDSNGCFCTGVLY